MYAIATLLEPEGDRFTQDIWSWLEENCNLTGVKMTPTPHFSWQGAEEYDLDKAIPAISNIMRRHSPFIVRTAGFGVFPGAYPVMYLSLVKTRSMMELHQDIWDTLFPLGINVNPYYAPDYWIPHITIAYRDLTPDRLACAMKGILDRPIEMELVGSNLAILYQVGHEVGIKETFTFLS
jgi:hypothetical protein